MPFTDVVLTVNVRSDSVATGVLERSQVSPSVVASVLTVNAVIPRLAVTVDGAL